jgi:hypothetical protein
MTDMQMKHAGSVLVVIQVNLKHLTQLQTKQGKSGISM